MSRSLSQAQVAKYLIKIRDAQESFESFVRLMYPDWELADFQLELIDALDKLEKDELGANNLLITMPPRHAKSTFGTVLFPSYYMARNPSRYVMSCSYNSQLATDFGRQVRSVVENKQINQPFQTLHYQQKAVLLTSGGQILAELTSLLVLGVQPLVDPRTFFS